MTDPDEAEIAYYRAVEDHFAALRGTPFLFSPKDFALLRRWWREGVPLAAVLAGIGGGLGATAGAGGGSGLVAGVLPSRGGPPRQDD